MKIIKVDRSNPNYRTINGKLTFVVPEGTECISKESVRENTNRLHIPTSVTTIDMGAIDAKNLKTVYIYHEHPENINIVDCKSEPVMLGRCTLYVPVGTGYAYRHHPYFGKLCKEVKACKLPPYGETLPDDQ